MLISPLPRNVEASFRDLRSQRPEVRVEAIRDVVRHARATTDLRARAAVELPPLLGDASPHVRAEAAIASADLAVVEAVPKLLALTSDDDGLVRQMAISALGELADPRAIPRLEHALKDPRPDVRYQALIAYTRVEEDDGAVEKALSRALSDDDRAVVHIALRIAEQRHDEGRTPGPDFTERASSLLDDAHPDVAVAAAIYAAKQGNEDAHATLLRAVRRAWPRGGEPGREEEQAAVELSGILGLTEATGALEARAFGFGRLLRETCSFSAKIALAAMGHERAKKALLVALSSAKPDERHAAIVGAGRARLLEARSVLEALADGPDGDLAKDALAAMSRPRRER